MAAKKIVRTIDGVTHIVTKKSWQTRARHWSRTSRLAPLVYITVVGVLIALFVIVHNADNKKVPDQVAQITALLSKHMVVPKNEQPIIATVTDKSSLRTPFLKEADNGDRIIVYEKAKRVIIYRPSIDRIVDIGPVELSNIPKTSTQ